MNFDREHNTEDAALAPEINLIPFIDILLVLVIFLMLTTTYVARDGLRISLPQAKASVAQEALTTLQVRVSAEGEMALNGIRFKAGASAALARAMLSAAASQDTVRVVIDADAQAPHQAVVTVMEAAGLAGLTQLHFSTRPANGR